MEMAGKSVVKKQIPFINHKRPQKNQKALDAPRSVTQPPNNEAGRS
jgi:hypothetical protein